MLDNEYENEDEDEDDDEDKYEHVFSGWLGKYSIIPSFHYSGCSGPALQAPSESPAERGLSGR